MGDSNMIYKNRKIEYSIAGINHKDYPDYVDAYIEFACYADTGEELTDSELDDLNEDSEQVYEAVIATIY